MFLIMGINLYTVRVILDAMGVIDYGIYNAVGGVVAMFSFISGTLTTSAQRYFSTYLAQENSQIVQNWFSLNSVVTWCFALFIFFLLETAGLWFLNNEMTIPEGRISAANIVYQLSIVTILLNVIKIPYDALIIAKERMKAFAMVGVIDAILKLAVAAILVQLSFDKLISYGILMLGVYIIIAVCYILYCVRNFPESKFRKYWNQVEFKELMFFSGWHFFGTVSSVIRSHGINLLLNVFFNPAVNAARAIAYQVNTAVSQFSTNFSIASRPQIYKSYAGKDYEGMNKLVMRSCVLCFFLYSIMVFPIIVNAELILSLWLKDVPDYSVMFTQIVLLIGLIECANTPLMASALCTTDIKKYTICVSVLTMLNLPISYAVLKLGGGPETTMYVTAILAFINLFVRTDLISRKVPISKILFYRLFFRVLLVSLIVLSILFYIKNLIISSIVMLFVSICISTLLIIVGFSLFVITRSDFKLFLNIVRVKVLFWRR